MAIFVWKSVETLIFDGFFTLHREELQAIDNKDLPLLWGRAVEITAAARFLKGSVGTAGSGLAPSEPGNPSQAS